MNEKFQDFRGLSAILIGYKSERLGKHLQLTSAFSLGTPIPHWKFGPGKDPTLRTKKTKCEDKALEVTSALWKLEKESKCFGTLSENRLKQQ